MIVLYSALGCLLSFALGGIGRRIAGGAVNEWFHRDVGDHPVRLFYGLTVAFSALMGGAAWPVAALTIPAVWLGTVTGNFRSLSMGHGEYSFQHDFWGMTAHGALSTAPCLLAWYAGLGWLAVALIAAGCLAAAPCYILGWWTAIRIGSQDAGVTAMPPGLRGGTQLAEVLWGGIHAATIFLAFIMG